MTLGPRVRYLGAFIVGVLVGGLIVDVLAARALQFQTIVVAARFYGEQQLLAERSRCHGDWLGVALHSWNAANSGLDPVWASLRPNPADGTLDAPLIEGITLGAFLETSSTPKARSVATGLDRSYFARALEQLGRPEADAQWQRAAHETGLSLDLLKKMDAPRLYCADPKSVQMGEELLHVAGYGADARWAP